MSTYTWSIPAGKEITGSTYLKDTDNYIGDTINDLVDFVNGEGVHLNQGMTYDFVDKATDQTITGVKNYTQPIIGNITGNVTGNVTGNANTSSKLETSRIISISGDAVGSIDFDGSSDVDISISLSPLIGMVIATARVSTPIGFLECNGASISRTTYSNLFSAIGTTYGTGDGSTTFQLPDLRGEFIRGFDNGRGVDSGRTFGSWQRGSLVANDDGTSTISTGSLFNGLNGFYDSSDIPSTTLSFSAADVTITANGLPFLGMARPRNIAMMYCIKY